jgi:hypothetical protein
VNLSEAAISYLSHRAIEALKRGGASIRNERLALQDVKRTIVGRTSRDPRIEEAVQRRIGSLQRRPPPGSAEYDVLYRQYYEQEVRKRRP